MIYLDSAATTLEKPSTVGIAVLHALRSCASPGRGGYPAGRKADRVIYHCRELAAQMFDVPDPEQVVITSNATHGLNLAIKTLVAPNSTVLISGYEHNAVTRVLRSVPGIRIRVALGKLFDAESNYEAFENMLTDDVSAVICCHVSNVFGYIQPIDRIAELCRIRKTPLIVDASQSAGTLPVSLKKWGAAFIAMPGHKGLYGPQGTGLLLCGVKPTPILYGGTGSASSDQEMPRFLPDAAEVGTQNTCGAAGLTAGIEFILRTGISAIFRHECQMREYMLNKLENDSMFRVFRGENQSGLFSFIPRNWDCEVVAEQLGRKGIAVRAGLHCAPLAHRTAGTFDTGTVRVSFSAFSRMSQLDYAVSTIREIVSAGRAN